MDTVNLLTLSPSNATQILSKMSIKAYGRLRCTSKQMNGFIMKYRRSIHVFTGKAHLLVQPFIYDVLRDEDIPEYYHDEERLTRRFPFLSQLASVALYSGTDERCPPYFNRWRQNIHIWTEPSEIAEALAGFHFKVIVITTEIHMTEYSHPPQTAKLLELLSSLQSRFTGVVLKNFSIPDILHLQQKITANYKPEWIEIKRPYSDESHTDIGEIATASTGSKYFILSNCRETAVQYTRQNHPFFERPNWLEELARKFQTIFCFARISYEDFEVVRPQVMRIVEEWRNGAAHILVKKLIFLNWIHMEDWDRFGRPRPLDMNQWDPIQLPKPICWKRWNEEEKYIYTPEYWSNFFFTDYWYNCYAIRGGNGEMALLDCTSQHLIKIWFISNWTEFYEAISTIYREAPIDFSAIADLLSILPN